MHMNEVPVLHYRVKLDNRHSAKKRLRRGFNAIVKTQQRKGQTKDGRGLLDALNLLTKQRQVILQASEESCSQHKIAMCCCT